MHYFGISSNIMSLGGIAIAIGVLVDAGIVMTENVIRHAENYRRSMARIPIEDRRDHAQRGARWSAGRYSSRWRSSFSLLFRCLL